MDKGHEMALSLRELIARPEGIYLYGVTTVAGALAVQKAGLDGVYLTGYGAAAIRGYPDLGIVTQKEMLEHVQWFTDCKRLIVPTLADADDGYGGVHNVRRTVEDLFTKTHVAAIHLEDQEPPKRCGHVAGRRVLPAEVALGKMRVAVKVRDETGPARYLVGRTDALGAANGKGLEDAGERACRFLDVGINAVWSEFGRAKTRYIVLFSEFVRKRHPGATLGINISTSFDDWEEFDLSPQDLASLGYKIAFSTYPDLKVLVHWNHIVATEFRENYIEGIKKLQRITATGSAKSIMELMGVPDYQAFEREFDPTASERQEKSEGFRR